METLKQHVEELERKLEALVGNCSWKVFKIKSDEYAAQLDPEALLQWNTSRRKAVIENFLKEHCGDDEK